MKIRVVATFLIAVAFGTTRSFAQQDAHFTQYMFNQSYFNPAAVGLEQGFRGGLLYRNQWSGYTGQGSGGAPTNILFTGSAPIMKYKMGIGLVVNSDKIGANTDLQVGANVAKHFSVGPGRLSVGLKLGVQSRSIDGGEFKVNDQNDPVYQALKASSGQLVADLGAGLFYQSDKWFAGFSANHLTEPQFDFGGGDKAKNTLNRHYYLTGGYNFELSPSVVLAPSVNVKSDSKVTQFEISALAKINNQFYAGLAYREQDAMSLILGAGMLKDNRLRITYSLDYTVPSTDAKKATSHEIMASYFLPMTMKGAKPVIRTPRYRK